jgi:hypothetical protein
LKAAIAVVVVVDTLMVLAVVVIMVVVVAVMLAQKIFCTVDQKMNLNFVYSCAAMHAAAMHAAARHCRTWERELHSSKHCAIEVQSQCDCT